MSKHSLSKNGPGVFVGPRFSGGDDAFRLDVYGDTQPGEFTDTFSIQPGPTRRRQRLAHFIAAGGMRQLRRTYAEDIADQHRWLFGGALAAAFLLWCLFYFLPTIV